MKIETDTENIAHEIRVLLNIEKANVGEARSKKDMVTKVKDYGFLGLERFADTNDAKFKSAGFYVMPLYEINL